MPVLEAERPLALKALDIEREGVANPRKDLRKWADFPAVYGYFFPELFGVLTDPADPRFGGLDPDLVRAVADAFARSYTPPGEDVDWFGQIRQLAADLGSLRTRRPTSRTPRPTPARSARPRRSSGSCSPARRAAPTWPRWPPRSAPTRSSAGPARCSELPAQRSIESAVAQ